MEKSFGSNRVIRKQKNLLMVKKVHKGRRKGAGIDQSQGSTRASQYHTGKTSVTIVQRLDTMQKNVGHRRKRKLLGKARARAPL